MEQLIGTHSEVNVQSSWDFLPYSSGFPKGVCIVPYIIRPATAISCRGVVCFFFFGGGGTLNSDEIISETHMSERLHFQPFPVDWIPKKWYELVGG